MFFSKNIIVRKRLTTGDNFLWIGFTCVMVAGTLRGDRLLYDTKSQRVTEVHSASTSKLHTTFKHYIGTPVLKPVGKVLKWLRGFS